MYDLLLLLQANSASACINTDMLCITPRASQDLDIAHAKFVEEVCAQLKSAEVVTAWFDFSQALKCTPNKQVSHQLAIGIADCSSLFKAPDYHNCCIRNSELASQFN